MNPISLMKTAMTSLWYRVLQTEYMIYLQEETMDNMKKTSHNIGFEVLRKSEDVVVLKEFFLRKEEEDEKMKGSFLNYQYTTLRFRKQSACKTLQMNFLNGKDKSKL